MPEISCMSPKLRQDVMELLKESGASKKDVDLFSELPECEKGVIKVRKGRGGSKRAPSAYNIFIGECTRGGKKTMAKCSVDWKAKK